MREVSEVVNVGGIGFIESAALPLYIAYDVNTRGSMLVIRNDTMDLRIVEEILIVHPMLKHETNKSILSRHIILVANGYLKGYLNVLSPLSSTWNSTCLARLQAYASRQLEAWFLVRCC